MGLVEVLDGNRGHDAPKGPRRERSWGRSCHHRGLVHPKASEGSLKGRGQNRTSSEEHTERGPLRKTSEHCTSHKTD